MYDKDELIGVLMHLISFADNKIEEALDNNDITTLYLNGGFKTAFEVILEYINGDDTKLKKLLQ